MDRSITSSELSFHGLPSKSKRPSKETENIVSSLLSVNSIIVFTKQPFAERYLANIFPPVFV